MGQPVRVGQGALYSGALQTGWILGSVVSEGNLVELVVLQQLLEKTLAQRGHDNPGASSLITPCPLPSAMAVESFTATAPFVQIGRFFLSAGMSWALAGNWAKQRPGPPLATPAVGVKSRIGPELWATLTPFLTSRRRGQNEAWGHGTPSLGHCWAEPLKEVLTPAVPESLGDIQHGAGM